MPKTVYDISSKMETAEFIKMMQWIMDNTERGWSFDRQMISNGKVTIEMTKTFANGRTVYAKKAFNIEGK